ncbi:MAG: hypothetical protein RIS88_2460 [Pseudomonadota bacterium]|jgi:hypothetical protein
MKDAGPPRFVPILTEVVQPPDDTPVADGPAAAAEDSPEAQVVARVRARVLAELEPLVLEALRMVQAQQSVALEARVRAELAARVERLVREAGGFP